MALINPEHLFVQADAFLLQIDRGSLRQADLRRAVSNVYYGLFHAILTAAVGEVVGRSVRGSPISTLAYRSISHQRLRILCEQIDKNNLEQKIKSYEPIVGFDVYMRTIARAVVELHNKRHAADYDPSLSFLQTAARAALQTARSAVNRLAHLRADQRRAFLNLTLFEPR